MRLVLLGVLLATGAGVPSAQAQTAQGDVSVTIYNDNLALVQDTRQMAIPAGRSRQEFPDVSGQIRSETVSFAASGTAIVGAPDDPGFARIQQGYLEASNVDPVKEITDLISAQRAYEMNSKIIKAADEMAGTVSQGIR